MDGMQGELAEMLPVPASRLTLFPELHQPLCLLLSQRASKGGAEAGRQGGREGRRENGGGGDGREREKGE